MERIHHVGYIINEHGVHVDQAKIQVIHDWTTLENSDRALQLLKPHKPLPQVCVGVLLVYNIFINFARVSML